LLAPFCRDRLLVAEEGALLPFAFPFRRLEVTGPFERLLVCRPGGELAAAFPDGRWPWRQLSGTIHGTTEGAFLSSISTHGASKSQK
jgi:hypothetical protein